MYIVVMPSCIIFSGKGLCTGGTNVQWFTHNNLKDFYPYKCSVTPSDSHVPSAFSRVKSGIISQRATNNNSSRYPGEENINSGSFHLYYPIHPSSFRGSLKFNHKCSPLNKKPFLDITAPRFCKSLNRD